MQVPSSEGLNNMAVALTYLCLAACNGDDVIDVAPKKDTSIFTFVNTFDVTT
ncbi:MAG: hypothetical protein ACI9YH_004437 [Colwellia sp.]|jgi:hypothetical protein